MKAISLHSIIPVRAEAREGAEQTTQMLFAETCDILAPLSEASPLSNWTHVRLDLDGQEGWVDAKMLTPMSATEYRAHKEACKSAAYVRFPMAYAVSENNGQTIPLTAGTRLAHYQVLNANGVSTARFEVLGVGFRIDPAMVAEHPMELNEVNLMQTVRFFLNVPYLWGGRNALGMDCSGFVQIIMSLFGKSLPRNASQQAMKGRAVSNLSKAQSGDLVFFDHEDGRISHVGIILQSQMANDQLQITTVHCSGRVKVEKLDQNGIFSLERVTKEHPEGQYTHHLVKIRRF